MLHRIGEAMKTDTLVATMSGVIVADETWIGGDPKNRHQHAPAPIRIRNVAHNQKTDKQAVFSIIDAHSGEVRSRIVPNVSGATLRKVMSEQVDMAGSILWSDGWNGYQSFGHEFLLHESVDHSHGEYVRNGVSTNTAENFFSLLKRSLYGTHHHVSVDHLPRYLAEFDFRVLHSQDDRR